MLTLSPILAAHDADAAVLADERLGSFVLEGAPEKRTTAEADDAAVVPDVLLIGLGNCLTGEADGQVEGIVWVVGKWMFHVSQTNKCVTFSTPKISLCLTLIGSKSDHSI